MKYIRCDVVIDWTARRFLEADTISCYFMIFVRLDIRYQLLLETMCNYPMMMKKALILHCDDACCDKKKANKMYLFLPPARSKSGIKPFGPAMMIKSSCQDLSSIG